MYKLLEKSQWWSTERITRYQINALQNIIIHAYRNVPAYYRRFNALGITDHTLKTLDDICYFPLLTKDDLRNDPQAYVARNISKEKLQYVTSVGTTGLPTGFYHIANYNDTVSEVFRYMMWKRIGYSPNLATSFLTASFPYEPFYDSHNKNILHVSISYLDDCRFPLCIEAITKLQPRFIIGYPSTVTLLVQLLKKYGVHLSIKGVITASEVMYEAQREYISNFFKCRVFEWYGLAEYAGFASACEYSDDFHFFPEAGYMELLDNQGNSIRERDKEGEIVLTGFYNLATPFIRYRTGDRATWGGQRCERCGRNYPLIRKILGRKQEFLISSTDRIVPNTILNTHGNIFEHVYCYQFYQDTPGKVTLRLVGGVAYTEEDTKNIQNFLLHTLGEDFKVDISFVNDIPRTSRGKHQFIIQKLQIPANIF